MSTTRFAPKTPLGRRVRLLIALNRVLVRAHIMPSSESAGSMPVAKRLALKPPAWGLLRATTHPRVENSSITGRHGDIPLRTYLPESGGPVATAVLYVHGGGWTVGGLDSLDWFCRELAVRGELAIISVQYHLAPDAPYPVPLDDVVGLDATGSSPSMSDRPGGLSRSDMRAAYGNYAGDHDPTDPEISPLLAADKAGLPATLVITAEHDILRDDGRLYAEQLVAAGVPARVVEYAGVDHGFLSLPVLAREKSLAALTLVVDELRTAPTVEGDTDVQS